MRTKTILLLLTATALMVCCGSRSKKSENESRDSALVQETAKPAAENQEFDLEKLNAAVAKYDKVGVFMNGLASVELNGEQRYIDKSGNEVIPDDPQNPYGLQLEEPNTTSREDGLTPAEQNGK